MATQQREEWFVGARSGSALANIPALRAFIWRAGRPALVQLIGNSAPGDSGGVFWWDSTSVLNDDGYLVVKEDATAIGRWIRQRPHLIDVRDFGYRAGSLSNQTSIIQAAATAAAAMVNTNYWWDARPAVLLPAGSGIVGDLTLPFGVGLVGAGSGSTILERPDGATNGITMAARPYIDADSDRRASFQLPRMGGFRYEGRAGNRGINLPDVTDAAGNGGGAIIEDIHAVGWNTNVYLGRKRQECILRDVVSRYALDWAGEAYGFDYQMYGCQWGNSPDGLYIGDGGNHQIYGNNFYFSTGTGSRGRGLVISEFVRAPVSVLGGLSNGNNAEGVWIGNSPSQHVIRIGTGDNSRAAVGTKADVFISGNKGSLIEVTNNDFLGARAKHCVELADGATAAVRPSYNTANHPWTSTVVSGGRADLPLASVKVLGSNVTPTNSANTTARQVLGTLTIPARLLAAGGALRITSKWTTTAVTANSKVVDVRVGTNVVASQQLSNQRSLEMISSLVLLRSDSAITSGPPTGVGPPNAGFLDYPAQNLNAAVTIEIAVTLAVGTEIVQLSGWFVELLP